MAKPAIHGRDHVPGKYGGTATGHSDKIDGMLYLPSASETDGQVVTRDSTATHGIKWGTSSGTGATYRNVDPVYKIEGAGWKVCKPWGSGDTETCDPTVPFGGYVELSGLNSYIVIGGPMGPPQYSCWAVTMAYKTGADGGQLRFDWQTTLVDGVFSGYGYGAGPFPESLEGAQTNNNTWYTHNGGSFHQDFYDGGGGGDLFTIDYSAIRIAGTDGTLLSANGSAFTDPPYGSALTMRDMNGGGGGNVMWWLRAKIVSRNAANVTGYKARIYHLGIHRVENTNGKYVN